MDEPESETTYDNTQSSVPCEAEEESPENECWEEEFNPLGLLDLVYVEEEDKNGNCKNGNDDAPSTSTNGDGMEQQNHPNANSDDSDEGEELEPVAAVDVLPGREEDFFPEGLTQEVMEPGRSTWSTFRVSNADTAHHQWSMQENQPVDGESILQCALELPQQMWTIPNQFLGLQSLHQYPWKLPHQVNMYQNNLSGDNQFHPPWRPPLQQEQGNLTRRLYYQRYRQKNPELVRIRNREYARRYRQTHAERVRERQREYIKRYRERKRLEQDQADNLFDRGSGNESIKVSDKNGLPAAVLLNRDNNREDIVAPNEPEITVAAKTKSSEHVGIDANAENEIVVLS